MQANCNKRQKLPPCLGWWLQTLYKGHELSPPNYTPQEDKTVTKSSTKK